MPIDRAPVAHAQSSPRFEMSVLLMGIALIVASVVVLVWAFPTRR